MRERNVKRCVFILIAVACSLAGPAGAQAPPEFTQVDETASQIDFKNIFAAINCGNATYEVKGVTFWNWNAPELQAYCNRSFSNLTGFDWNGTWPNPFTDPELDQLDEIYMSIGYWDQPTLIEFTNLNPTGAYKIQFLYTANAQWNFDHGGSLKVTGETEQWISQNFHLNTFAMGIPFVVTAEDIQPNASGIIRVDYVQEATWVCAPACDANKIWSGIMISGPPITFPSDLGATKEGDSIKLSWVNHEPSTNGAPYDQIEILVDGQVRGILGEGAATIDEANDNKFSLDLTKPENAGLLEGAHVYTIRTTIAGYVSLASAAYGIAPIRIACGPYVDPYTAVTTSDGRVWTTDAFVIRGDRFLADWTANVDPIAGVAGIEQFGLNPMDPADQSLFARFNYNSGRDTHLKARIPMPNGTYDVKLYFWEYASPWIYDRKGQVFAEGGPATFFAYGDPEGIYAAMANEGWMLLLESVAVADGVMDVDFLAGWTSNLDVTLAALEVLPADPAPKGPKNLRVTTTGNKIYNLTWEIPAGATYEMLNVLSRMSGQKESLANPAATSLVFEQEIDYESTNNEAFAVQARNGNIFYPQIYAGAGVGPMYIDVGRAGDVVAVPPANITAPRTARGLTWVTDLGYVTASNEFVGPLLTADRILGNWGTAAYDITPGSPADELDPPFETAEHLAGEELALMQDFRWTWTPGNNDPIYMPMVWDVPINEGKYTVRLYFAEGCCLRAADFACEGSDPQRIYYNGLALDDVPPDDREWIEGSFDVVSLVGTVSLLEFADVDVSDGYLSIACSPFCLYLSPYDSNPTVSAIEVLPSSGPPPELFKRGDTNNDNTINIADAIFLLGHLFGGGPAPTCQDTADANDDGSMNIADAISVLGHLFGGTGPLKPPFGACGPDPTADTLPACNYPPCK